MQDKYVADVGDFGKFGLLRHLLINPEGKPPTLGVLWYWVPKEIDEPKKKDISKDIKDEKTNLKNRTPEIGNDGKHISYLEKINYQECDPKLLTALSVIIKRGNRDVAALEASGILPANTVYNRENVSCIRDGHDLSVKTREGERGRWKEGSQRMIQNCDLIFLDPDNGIKFDNGVQNDLSRKRKAGKYAFWNEVEAFWKSKRCPSLVLYHHLGRNGGSHDNQIGTLQKELEARFSLGKLRQPVIHALRYHGGTSRAFFVILHPDNKHKNQMQKQLNSFYHSLWFANGHFSRPTSP